MEHISYKKQTEIVNFQGREIPLEIDNLSLRLVADMLHRQLLVFKFSNGPVM